MNVLDPIVALVGAIMFSGVFAALVAPRLARSLGVSPDRAFNAAAAAGGVILGSGCIAGLVVGNLFNAYEVGQAIGSYVAAGIGGLLACVFVLENSRVPCNGEGTPDKGKL